MVIFRQKAKDFFIFEILHLIFIHLDSICEFVEFGYIPQPNLKQSNYWTQIENDIKHLCRLEPTVQIYSIGNLFVPKNNGNYLTFRKNRKLIDSVSHSSSQDYIWKTIFYYDRIISIKCTNSFVNLKRFSYM